MSILIDKKTRGLIQGITGHEGARACREMLSYGTRVLAGVTPGKGGRKIEGVPVYDSVREAILRHPGINTSLIAVPALFVRDAAAEAIANKIPLVNILTEHVTVRDSAWIIARARREGVRVVGPSSVGIISPGKGKIGSIGSSAIEKKIFSPGHVGIISKSGGMTAEIGVLLTRQGIGQSTAVGIGGDPIIGSDFADLLVLFEQDPATKAVVLFGEVGGSYEEEAARLISQRKFTKPVVAIIAGYFTKDIAPATVLGHAGAIVSRGRGGYYSKVLALKKAGVHVASTLEDIPKIIKSILRL